MRRVLVGRYARCQSRVSSDRRPTRITFPYMFYAQNDGEGRFDLSSSSKPTTQFPGTVVPLPGLAQAILRAQSQLLIRPPMSTVLYSLFSRDREI